MGEVPLLRLFGTVSIVRDGRRVSAGGPRQAGVLAMLATSIGRPVSTGRIIDGVWGDHSPDSVTNVLQVYISSIRKLLKPCGLAVNRNGGAYVLEASLDDVDVERFERSAAEGTGALRLGDHARALAALDRAHDLWDSEPFAGLDDCPFVSAARARLLATGLAVIVGRGESLCALGRADEAAAVAEAMVANHPFHEPAWELLMRSLYHSGRQHDALLAFTRARTTFVEELGLDPPSALIDLERQILDRTLTPPPANDGNNERPTPADAAQAAPGSRLPALGVTVVGRHDEIEFIVRAFDADTRLVTVVGLGGIGKTTIALAAARLLRASDTNVAFCDLSEVHEADVAIGRVLECLGIAPDAEPEASLIAADPDVVVVMDNLEQVSAIGQTLGRVLAGTTRLRVLATSRLALRVRAEHRIHVQPLSTSTDNGPSEAAALFCERARRRRADLVLSGDEPEVAEICNLAGGIPLAIEIAAGQLGHFSLIALRDRLQRQPLRLLEAAADDDVPDRQHSLRTVIDATLAALTSDARNLLGRLCPVSGPISVDFIERLCADEPELVDALPALVETSLMSPPDDDGRYRLPLPVAEHIRADSRLAEGSEPRLLATVLALASSVAGTTNADGSWGEQGLVADAAAVTAACQAISRCGEVDEAAGLIVALKRYWLLTGRLAEALSCCDVALALPISDGARIAVQLVTGQFAAIVDREDASVLLADAIDRADQSGAADPGLLLNSRCYLGARYCAHGDAAGARAIVTRVRSDAAASQDRDLIELARDFAAFVAAQLGEFEEAALLSAEALHDARRRGDRYVLADVMYRYAENLLDLGRIEEADAMVDEAMRISGTLPMGPMSAKVLLVRALVDVLKGQPSSAIGAALEALRLTTTRYPAALTQASALRILAAAHTTGGNIGAAARCAGAADVILQRAGALDGAPSLSIQPLLQRLSDDPRAIAVLGTVVDPSAVIDEMLGATGT